MNRLMMLSTLLVFSLSIGCSETGTEPDARQPNSLETLKKNKPTGDEFVFWAETSGITASGETWRLNNLSWRWERIPKFDPPVPVSEIAFFDADVNGAFLIVTTSGDGWVREGAAEPWVNSGSRPTQ